MEGEPQKGTPSVPSRGIEAEAHPGTTGCNLHGQRREFISKATDRWAYDNRVADIRNKRLVLLYVD